MAQKSHKTDVRLYIEDDYKEYLKLLAEEQNISVNRLIMDVVQKKYPFPCGKDRGDHRKHGRLGA